MRDDDVVELVTRTRSSLTTSPNRFLSLLETGSVPRDRLALLAGELYRLVRSDRRSFALLASRFPAPLFLEMAAGEDEALRLLRDFGAVVGMGEQELLGYEPRPLAQVYPAYLAQTAAFGPSCAVPFALLVNVSESGESYARAADALVARYGLAEPDVAHFRYFATTPDSVLSAAATVVAAGLSAGEDRAEAVRCARLVSAYEATFWATMADGL